MSEKAKILKMVEDGIITSEEALKLLDAVEENVEQEVKKEKIKLKGKKLKIKVFDPADNTKVDIKIPLSLINLGLTIGTKIKPELKEKIGDIDIDEIIKNAIDDFSETGNQTLVDIEEENGTIVKIYIE
jgi:hypothetical protein